jgi:hypothetical protein
MQWRVRDVGRGRNGAYGMSGADPVGDSGKAGTDGRTDGRGRGCANGSVGADGSSRYGYVGTDVSGSIVMWARTLRRV